MSVMRKHLSLGIALALSASFLVAPANPLSTVAPATAAPAPAPTIGCNTAALQQHLDSILNQGGLSSFGGIVTNSLGKTYWDKSADRLLAPASVTKLLTAYSALHVLDRNARQKTTVSLAIDGSLVLHGTGDVTISRRKNGRTFYRNAPRLNDLANQVKRKLDRVPPALRPKRLIIDNGSTVAPPWRRAGTGRYWGRQHHLWCRHAGRRTCLRHWLVQLPHPQSESPAGGDAAQYGAKDVKSRWVPRDSRPSPWVVSNRPSGGPGGGYAALRQCAG